MNLQAAQSVDLWKLFCHDNEEISLFDEYAIEEQINFCLNDLLGTEYSQVRVICSNECGLYRWIIEWAEWGEEEPKQVTKRIYSKDQLRGLIPQQIAEALDKINKRSFTLGK